MSGVLLMRREDDKELMKEAFKEAAKEWLRDQFAAFGVVSAVGAVSFSFYVLVKIAIASGWWPK